MKGGVTMKLGVILKTCREFAGLSQEELAARMNRSQTCISRYENERKVPDVFTFMDWFKQTNTQEVGITLSQGLMSGLDIATVIQTLLPIVGGFAWLSIF